MTIPVWDTEEQKAITAKWRRERIAVAAMTGLLAMEPMATPFAERDVVRAAIRMADALIAALDEERK